MMALMVKESDLYRIDVPKSYEVLDATALGRRLGFKRNTVLAYLCRRNFGRIAVPIPLPSGASHVAKPILWASGEATVSDSFTIHRRVL